VEIAGVQAAVGVVSSKWSVAILAELMGGTRRFNELLRAIDGISRRMLAATLRRLEHDGLIARRVYADVPVRVEYDLTRAGTALFAALTPLSAWSLQHLSAAA
jgi:DNA-binding HxlR family transcriptional regulator